MEARRAATMNLGPGGLGERFNYDVFEPTYTCHTETRRGKPIGDGGKYVCGEPQYFRGKEEAERRCLVYSVGSNGDKSFEEDVGKNFGCEVHTFDPTGDSRAYENALYGVGATFHAIGVSASSSQVVNAVTGQNVRMMPLKELMDSMGHSKRHLDVLKIDCEGCEHAAFQVLWPQLSQGDVSIGQIQVEIHGTNYTQLASFFQGADDAGFMIFHKEPNSAWCDGYRCMEYSLIHRKEAKKLFTFAHC